ncbi:MAG: GDP-mannose 4,6-dehydratase [Lachnospiraceae bacterium]|nr:GDP-mannose 4,6-dehydratase [Lachnospiraceae bacterium]
MKILIIGAAGFVGGYLIHHLHTDLSDIVYATKLPHEHLDTDEARIYDLNILEPETISPLLEEIHPDAVIHLAAQSSVSVSWKKPDLTVDINIKGTLYLLEAIRNLDYSPRVLLVGSGEEYGHILPDETPIKETNHIRPGNIYAVTKACQNMIGKLYCDAYKMDIMSVRAFNHIGPKQTDLFVVSDFCKQIAQIEAGLSAPVLHVGNLSAARDFTDVRDVVRAYAMLIRTGRSGETYNVGSGQAVTIDQILHKIIAHSSADIQVEVDPAKLRPVDVPIIEADISKLQTDTEWEPTISIDDTIEDVLAYWRQQL